ncbi:mitochondrial carrier protein CoAc1-like [Pyrus communis]|uniref:mitochondrial carrier protein CoAc1-like n=1 Tax=Pyrus communis TaxID=23211 RepID=UPI0035BFECF2
MSIEQYRCWILNNYSTLGSGPHIDLLAGAATGGTAVLCTYPLDLARTKLAYQVVNTRGNINYGMKGTHHQIVYKGIRDVLSSVYKEGGFRGLYRGVGPTLTGILPYAGLKFYIYEELKLHVPEEYEKSIVMRLSCGALAGLFGQMQIPEPLITEKVWKLEDFESYPACLLMLEDYVTFCSCNLCKSVQIAICAVLCSLQSAVLCRLQSV